VGWKKRCGRALRRVPERLHDCFRQRFVFIHINKTGGSSIEDALGLRHEHRLALEKRADIGARRFEEKFCFTVVRNPWDRVASHYFYRVKTNQTGLGERTVPFPEWARRAYAERDPAYYDKPRMFMPQLDWLSDTNGRLLVEFVGRFERLQADFDVICARLGIEASLPHLRSSGKGDYRAYYDDATAEMVADYFARDIEAFGYSFEPEFEPTVEPQRG
jgi:chondroitin 4-sulfotransferase 11